MNLHWSKLILGVFLMALTSPLDLAAADNAPSTGDTKAFVLLIKFPNDNQDHNDCYADYWPNSLGHALPDWADTNNLLHPDTTSANFAEGSLSDFWDQMSVGNYCFYGDVYDTVYQPEHNTGYYEWNNRCYEDSSANYASGYVIWEALTNIDDAVDYSQYDNLGQSWSPSTRRSSGRETPST